METFTRCPTLAWDSPWLSWSRAQLLVGIQVRCSPAGALVQLGGVLALHVVLRGPLPIENEQLLGLPVMLDSSLLEKT